MYELLLRPSSHLDLGSLLGYAERLGLDVGRFQSDVADNAFTAKIERDVREGIQNGVNATPKFYVNGERIDGKLPLEGLENAVRAVAGPPRQDHRNGPRGRMALARHGSRRDDDDDLCTGGRRRLRGRPLGGASR
jgi:hypothetical protein